MHIQQQQQQQQQQPHAPATRPLLPMMRPTQPNTPLPFQRPPPHPHAIPSGIPTAQGQADLVAPMQTISSNTHHHHHYRPQAVPRECMLSVQKEQA
ncbi:hypothetical protein BDF14DRAFT_968587 [Spinellus fusiger]|nr:hypothetical protein BDF14DRAFT_968587 [Spinellus fusiger]